MNGFHNQPMAGPLAGMRVLDLSQQLPGPYATFLLAGMGADVLKVEPPAGDPARQFDPPMFERVNQGKRSVTLDLKSDQGRARLLKLAGTHDVLVEGFRPGVMARLGCDEATVRAVAPGIIYCSISGMGPEGPLATHPTHDLSLQSMVGALADTKSDRIGVPWVDLATATTAALSIVAAWHAARPCHLELAMLDAAQAWAHVKPLAVLEPEATYGVVRVRDGAVTIALLEDRMWHGLCVALGWADWATASELSSYLERRIHAARIRARLDQALGRLTVAEVLRLAEEHDLPIGPVDGTKDPRGREQLASRHRDTAVTEFSPLPTCITVNLGPAPALPGT